MALQTINARIYFHLAPCFIGDHLRGVHEQLDSYLMRYIPELKGVPISYSNVHIVEDAGNVLYDSPNTHFNATCRFVLFAPTEGSILVGLVNKVSSDHIGLLVHGVFNASIAAEHVRKTEFKFNNSTKVWNRCVDGNETADSIAPGSIVKFTVVGLPTNNNMLTLTGSLTTDPYKTGLIALDSSKVPPHPTPIIAVEVPEKKSKKSSKTADAASADATTNSKMYFDVEAEENDAQVEDADEFVVEAVKQEKAVKEEDAPKKKKKASKKASQDETVKEEVPVKDEVVPVKEEGKPKKRKADSVKSESESDKKEKKVKKVKASPCCKRWFDCPECHAEQTDHNLRKTAEMVFACKKCKKVFRKDLETFDESDEYCPNCDNHFIIDAKTPQMAIGVEGDDPRLNRDYREKQKQFIEQDLMSDRLG
ncbi:hypothetical protein HDU80_007065 [Chytriomyces hyalinus]|nr:hypothetical protein HDU80_007065 [Chytriomyces hyalinus]